MSDSTPRVFRVTPGVQCYAWGALGTSSRVAQLAAASASLAIDERTPYAELWMGTHPALPSALAGGGGPLRAHLAAHPELLGEPVARAYAGDLPFLLKVLSVRTALSIQAHPDRALARVLHAAHPEVYKDANHKPEMALALTPFVALCGFCPVPALQAALASVPELSALVPEAARAAFAAEPDARTLRDVFAAVMGADAALVATQLDALVARCRADAVPGVGEDARALVPVLAAQYPGDVGVFCALLLNIVRLAPGEALFLGAGEPHAYVSGDIVECMATSDNVLRAGLTPKARDVPALLAALTYATGPGEAHRVEPKEWAGGSHTTLYDPPAEEFSVLATRVPAAGSAAHAALDGPSIALVTSGEGTLVWGGARETVRPAAVVFIGAGEGVVWEAEAGTELEVHRAFTT